MVFKRDSFIGFLIVLSQIVRFEIFMFVDDYHVEGHTVSSRWIMFIGWWEG